MFRMTFLSAAAVLLCLAVSLPASAGSKYRVVMKNGSFDKPVIFVEGYDANNQRNWSDYRSLIRNRLKDFIRQTDRDIAFVNFPNGGARIQDNASYLIDAIQQVNRDKDGNHPNAVIGVSMGGVVSRWALAKMERKGWKHDTSLYVSYDAPHRGANIPVQVRNRTEYYYGKVKARYGSTRANVFFKDGRKEYRSPAARQMLVWQNRSGSFYRKLERLGYPKKLARVAFSHGSGEGDKQGFQHGENVLAYRLEAKLWRLRRWYHSVGPRRLSDQRCTYPCDPTGVRFYDNAPGGTFNSFSRFRSAILANNYDYIWDVNVRKWRPGQYHSFVPTLSALDIRNFDLNRPVGRGMKRRSPFDRAHALTYNRRHDGLMAYWHARRIENYLGKWHKREAGIPDRGGKIKPLKDVRYAAGEWQFQGYNILRWPAVRGAKRYEIYTAPLNGGSFTSSPVMTVTNTSAYLNVMKSKRVAIRACRGAECSYPAITKAYYRPDLQPF